MSDGCPIGSTPLGLFGGYGVEAEYMIVDREDFEIRSLADVVLQEAAGGMCRQVARGPLCWSNELVLHVLELKTNGPVRTLDGLHERFRADVGRINGMLEAHGACLMPSAMHPFMEPDRQATLWPYEDGEIYAALDRVFACAGHGWKNLQSIHLNLPFGDEAEFVRLHAAVRMVLPLIPAIAAASPFADGRDTGILDYRLIAYEQHCRRFPLATGAIIPEPVNSIEDYRQKILAPIYRAIRPHDPEGILAHEWINARGAIARFERNTIEIRLIDVQECPLADAAVMAAVSGAVQWLLESGRVDSERMNAVPTQQLGEILRQCVRDADQAVIRDAAYLEMLGIKDGSPMAGQVWRELIGHMPRIDRRYRQVLEGIVRQGPLARRMKHLVMPGPEDSQRMRLLCGTLCACLGEGRMLTGDWQG